jgi:ankyrin repeat protein
VKQPTLTAETAETAEKNRGYARRSLRAPRLTVALVAAASTLAFAAPSDEQRASPKFAPQAGASEGGLIDAVRSRDVQSVRALLEQRADVNAPQGDGATALHWAAHVDDLVIADLLIRAGARPGAANDVGATPLHLACTNRSAPMVERLLAAGANANAKLLNGETVLMTCSRAGAASAVKALLTHGADVNAKESAHDQTPLMWAVAQSHPEVVQLLLESGADMRARSRTYPQTVVGVQTQRAGREKLNYTVLRGGSTPLLFAARVGDMRSARTLLAAGADANDSLPDGTSALVLAAHSGHGGVAALLLDKGADPNAFGTGYTALHAAVLRSDVTLVKALLAHGAKPDVRMTKGTPLRRDTTDFNLPATLVGSTPYLLAARFLEPEIVRALAAGGADQTLTLQNGATPLMLAVGMGTGPNESRRGIAVIDFGKVEPESRVLETVRAVAILGGDVNAANEAGDTAMHTAAGQGYDTVVRFLADHGAQINAKNGRGLTPLGALLSGARGRGRGGAADANGADLTGVDAPVEGPHQSTAALLRKLGAIE